MEATSLQFTFIVSKEVVIQSPCCGQLFATPGTAARQASISLTISRSLPKFMSIESVMLSNHLILCCLFSFYPQSFSKAYLCSHNNIATATAAKFTSVMSDSMRPHRRQPTRLPHPWDSPGKNTGVGCHFLLQCMKVKSESEVAQSCPTLSDPMDGSPLGSSAHGIFQARVLEWGAIAFSHNNISTT